MTRRVALAAAVLGVAGLWFGWRADGSAVSWVGIAAVWTAALTLVRWFAQQAGCPCGCTDRRAEVGSR